MSNYSILFIIKRFVPEIGGGELQAFRLARELVAQGHHVTVLTRHRSADLPREETLEGVRIIRLGLGRLGMAREMLTWAVRHAKEFDLIHAFQALSPALVGALAKMLTRKPLVLTLFAGGYSKREGDLYFALGTSRVGQLYRPILRKADVIVGKSDESIREVKDLLGRDAIKIPNGVDVSSFVPTKSIQPELRACFVGRLEMVKDPATLFTAWRHVLEICPNARLSVIGDGGAAEVFRLYARQVGVEEAVDFFGAQTDTASFLQNSRVFVLSSIAEGLPNVVLEAMACGLPVVSTIVGAVPEVIEDGKTGYLVPCGDAEGLAHGISSLLQDPERARQMGAAGLAVVTERFGLNQMRKRYEEIYQQLMHLKRPAAPPRANG